MAQKESSRDAVMEAAAPFVDLQTCLARKTVPQLRRLAADLRITGISKLCKSELAGVLRDDLLRHERLEAVLYSLERPEWALFQKSVSAANAYPSKADTQEPGGILCALGYLQTFQHEGRQFYIVPADVRALYRKLAATGFRARKERDDLIHTYAMAAVNLYGVIRQDDLISIFNSQNREKLTEAELFPTLLRHIILECGYVVWEEYLVNDAFEANEFRDVADLVGRIGDKPRYIPPKPEFLRYADFDYYEETAATLLMKQYLRRDAGLSPEDVEAVMSELHFAILLEVRPVEYLNILSDCNISIPREDLQIVLDILSEMANSTRLWSNNGQTPNEIFKLYERPHLKKLPAKALKIGRNAPCPCGSGKKYKKCCGR